MLRALAIVFRILLSPVWLGWRAYQGLWWAFGAGDDRSVVAAAPEDCAPPGAPPRHPDPATSPAHLGQDRSFEVSQPAPPKTPSPPVPVGTLRVGYTITLLVSLATGLLAANRIHTSSYALLVWGWITACAGVASIYVVRAVVARRERERPKTRLGRAASLFRGIGDTATDAALGLATLCRAGARGAKASRAAAGRAASWPPLVRARQAIARRIRPSPETPRTGA